MPPARRGQTAVAEALVSVAPLINRWIERLLAGHDPPLTVAQFLALRSISAEEMSRSELALRTGVSGPAVSQLLTGLNEAGLLERREFSGDRRRLTLEPTPRGQRALASAEKLLRERLASLLSELPPPEADALARSLGHLAALLSGTPPPRRPAPRPPAGPPPRR